ncbi:RNA polymerase I associated factor, A49-like protein [Kockovaella imperatae]|uniref:RNA polymerase I associated factor, A49-like protein n=1 Tax=Kockovaella imperatae TaxID=4999 RepID=A0A1Y1UNT8_9TREE|nr:RNA polymerase I associated factor, A49-like protein [Kockovaella imperatae]ORX39701.1 RNA polymerase I associated factor, A49-like protein [Kockovaella imperatae]
MSSAERSKKSHKRKSVAVEDGMEAGPSTLNVTVTEPSSSLGPVFVNFPSIRPSKDTPFRLYSRDADSGEELALQATLLAGDTEDVDFVSSNRNHGGSNESSDCQYLPAVYDPDAGTLQIHASSPLYLMVHRSKRMTNVALQMEKADDYRTKRNNLGEVFGTRKAKSQIRAEERNKLNADAMQDVRGHLMETIGAKEAEAEALPSELIPTPNTSTDDPAQVYPRESMISDGEWSCIDASTLLKQKDDRSRALLLPYRRSRFIETKMREVSGSAISSSLKKSSMRMCFFLSSLMALNDRSGDIARSTTAELGSKFSAIPAPLLNGLLERFTESLGNKRKITDKLQTKLLAWICVAYLHLSDFKADVTSIAKDLSFQPAKLINIFKSLGCRIDIPSPEEREQLGVTLDGAKALRKAVLRAPVQFPKPKTRAPARGRR